MLIIFDTYLIVLRDIFKYIYGMIYCSQKRHMEKFILSIVFFLFICTIAGNLSAQEMSLFSFGKGQIQVRLYVGKVTRRQKQIPIARRI